MGGLKSRKRETAKLAEVRTQRNRCLASPFKIDSADWFRRVATEKNSLRADLQFAKAAVISFATREVHPRGRAKWSLPSHQVELSSQPPSFFSLHRERKISISFFISASMFLNCNCLRFDKINKLLQTPMNQMRGDTFELQLKHWIIHLHSRWSSTLINRPFVFGFSILIWGVNKGKTAKSRRPLFLITVQPPLPPTLLHSPSKTFSFILHILRAFNNIVHVSPLWCHLIPLSRLRATHPASCLPRPLSRPRVALFVNPSKTNF